MNIAEILKYCPKGTKLYSTAFGEVELISIYSLAGTILVQNPHDTHFTFYSNGSYTLDGECVLFPSRDQRDWSKFRLPVKRGDIMMGVNGEYPFITTGEFYQDIAPKYICGINSLGNFQLGCIGDGWTSDFYIPASEEVKKKLFDKMAEAGYKWNADTLELEKIEPKFKEGDVLINSETNTLFLSVGVMINDKIQGYYLFANDTFAYSYVSISLLKLASITDRNKLFSTIVKGGYKYDKEQHKLVKQELKPFEKVLVRNSDFEPWKIDFYSTYIENKSYHYICASNDYKICISYEGNEYLLGTTN